MKTRVGDFVRGCFDRGLDLPAHCSQHWWPVIQVTHHTVTVRFIDPGTHRVQPRRFRSWILLRLSDLTPEWE